MTFLSPFGYTEDPQNIDEFETLVSTATDAKNGACWALGDLYNLAQEARWRDSSDQFFSETKVTLPTLRNYASVCRHFKRERRVYDLSFGHYDVVKAMNPDEQDDLLLQAVKGDWSRETLRDAWRNYKGVEKQEKIKTTCKVVDLIAVLTSKEFGLSENDTIDITAKLVELEAAA